MHNRLVLVAISFVVLAAVCFGGWRVYQRHLSSDLKRTLVAAADPTASEADILSYLRDARVQVRTEHDKELLGQLQGIVQLSQQIAEDNRISDEVFHDMLSGMGTADPCLRMSVLSASEKNSSYGQDLRMQCNDQIQMNKIEKQRGDQAGADVKRATDELKKTYAAFRSNLNLPPVKE